MTQQTGGEIRLQNFTLTQNETFSSFIQQAITALVEGSANFKMKFYWKSKKTDHMDRIIFSLHHIRFTFNSFIHSFTISLWADHNDACISWYDIARNEI